MDQSVVHVPQMLHAKESMEPVHGHRLDGGDGDKCQMEKACGPRQLGRPPNDLLGGTHGKDSIHGDREVWQRQVQGQPVELASNQLGSTE